MFNLVSNNLVQKYRQVSDPLPIEEESHKMTLEENGGVFVLFLVMISINLIVMAVEMIWWILSPRADKKIRPRHSIN